MGENLVEKKMSYEVAGENVELTIGMIKNFLTKGQGNVSDAEALMFMNLCKYQKLNPFLNEAYLVKYGSAPAQKIVSKEAYMKKAESNPNYDGFTAGIIVKRNNDIVELEGAFKLTTDVLLGGWATVYRTDRKKPITMKVSMEEYGTGKSTWKDKPCTMVRKVAIVQAQREAFPRELGALYTDIEQGEDLDEPNEPPLDIKPNEGPEVTFPEEADEPEDVEPVENPQSVDNVVDNSDEQLGIDF